MKKAVSAAYALAVCAMFVYTLVFSRQAADAAYEALLFCGRTLVPQLFVGTVLAGMLVSMPDVISALSRFGERGCGLTVLLIGLLCGAQTGAVVLYGMYSGGCISKAYAEKALCFCGGASASFLIGFVGTELKGDVTYGIKLFVLQAVLMLIFFAISGGKTLPCAVAGRGAGVTDAISRAALITVDMCASVVFFSVASSVMAPLFPEPLSGYVRGTLEFSEAIVKATSDGHIGWAVGFGGVCVLMQLIGVTDGLSHKYLAAAKVIAGVLFAILTKAVL